MIARSLPSPPTIASAGQGRSRGSAVAVDAGDVGGVRDAFQREAHAEQGRLEDVDAVDLLDLDEHDVPRQRARDDAVVQLLAPRRRQLLGIVESVDARASRVEHDRGDHDRTGQRAAPGFVDAGNTLDRDGARRVRGLQGHGRATSSGDAHRQRAREASRRNCSVQFAEARLQRRDRGRIAQPVQHRGGELVGRAVVLHQLRHQRVAGQHVRQCIAVDLEHAHALDDRMGERRDAIADHHRPLGQHRFQRGGARGEQDHVAGDHQRARVADDRAQGRGQCRRIRMRVQHALERTARLHVGHRHDDLEIGHRGQHPRRGGEEDRRRGARSRRRAIRAAAPAAGASGRGPGLRARLRDPDPAASRRPADGRRNAHRRRAAHRSPAPSGTGTAPGRRERPIFSARFSRQAHTDGLT